MRQKEESFIQLLINQPVLRERGDEAAHGLSSPAPPGKLSAVKSFLEQFCRNLGLECRWPVDNAAELQLTDEAAGLIDGPRTPGYSLRLALSQDAAEVHEDAEFFTPGSYRWDRFLAITHHKGKLCRQYVVGIAGFLDGAGEPEADMGELTYEPHLLIQWRLNYRTQQVNRRRILDLTVNLVTGHLEAGYYQYLLQGCSLGKEPLPFIPIAKRRLGFKAAYQLMSDEIRYLLTVEDSSWAQAASQELAQEIQALEQYYNNRTLAESTNSLLAAEKAMRIQELQRRSQPRVLASPFAAALLYIPMISYQASIGGQTLCLRFDPVAGHLLE